MYRNSLGAAATALVLAALPLQGVRADATDAQIAEIVDEGLSHSQLMANASELMDGIGPRLTNSENFDEAAEWALAKFREYGLSGVRKESYPFGVNWNLDSWSAAMVEPRAVAMRSIPVAWSPPTNGTVAAPVILAPMSKPEHFDAWRGKLAGKIVLISLPGAAKDATDPAFERLSGDDIRKMDEFQAPNNDPDSLKPRLKRRVFVQKLDAFLKAEGAVAWAKMSPRGGALLHGDGSGFKIGQTPQLPGMEIAAEDYRRLARLAKIGPVSVEINSNVHYDDSDPNGYNILADIPGSDPGAGYVMAGAHLDSWVAGDGAADNAAGSAVVMEAARILSTLGVRPKRTSLLIFSTGASPLFASRARRR
jgi:hypothetical protein